MCVSCIYLFFFFKQKTAYEMRISDWSSDVCSSDLFAAAVRLTAIFRLRAPLRDLILRAGAREEGEPAAPTRLAANLWHVAFAILVVVDFTGLVYSGLLAGETRFVSLALGSFLVLSLTPFAVGGYGALIDDLMLSGGGDGRRLGAAGALKAFGQGVILLAAFAFLASAWGGDPFAGERAGLLSRLAAAILQVGGAALLGWRSEEHTSELQSLMRI